MYSAKIKEVSDESAIPDPKGYKILIAIPAMEEKTAGGILRPDSLLDREATACIFGYVTAMGADCYKDKNKFPGDPWCKLGDWVVFRSYSGTRLRIDGQDFRLINDDMVEAVVDDPRKIERGY